MTIQREKKTATKAANANVAADNANQKSLEDKSKLTTKNEPIELLDLQKQNALLVAENEKLKTDNRKAVRRYSREEQAKPYQAELIRMQQYLEKTGTRMIILFEGRDAAGKGGTIRRVTR